MLKLSCRLFIIYCLTLNILSLFAFEAEHGVSISNGRTAIKGLHLWKNHYIAFNKSLKQGQSVEVTFNDSAKLHGIVQSVKEDFSFIKTISKHENSTPMGIEVDYTPERNEKVYLIPNSQVRTFVFSEAVVYKPISLSDDKKAFSIVLEKAPTGTSFLVCNESKQCIGTAFFKDPEPLLQGKITTPENKSIMFYRPFSEDQLIDFFGPQQETQLSADLHSLIYTGIFRPNLNENNEVEFYHKDKKFSISLENKTETLLSSSLSKSNRLFYVSDNQIYSNKSSYLYFEKKSIDNKLPKALKVCDIKKVLYSDDDTLAVLGLLSNKPVLQIINPNDSSISLEVTNIVNAIFKKSTNTILVYFSDKVSEYKLNGEIEIELPGSPLSKYDSKAQFVLNEKGVLTGNIIYDTDTGDPFYELPEGTFLSEGAHANCLVGFNTNQNQTELQVIENQKIKYKVTIPYGNMKNLHYLNNGLKELLIGELDTYSIVIPWEVFEIEDNSSWEPFFISGLSRKPDLEYFNYYEDWVFGFDSHAPNEIESIAVLSTNSLLTVSENVITYPCKDVPLKGEDVKLKVNYTNGLTEVCQFELVPFSYERNDEFLNASSLAIDFESKKKVVVYSQKNNVINICDYPPNENVEEYKLPKRVDRVFKIKNKLLGINFNPLTILEVDIDNVERTKTSTIKDIFAYDAYNEGDKVYILAEWYRKDIRIRQNIQFLLSSYTKFPSKINELRNSKKSVSKTIESDGISIEYQDISSPDKSKISIAWKKDVVNVKGGNIDSPYHPFYRFYERGGSAIKYSRPAQYISSTKLVFQSGFYKISSGSVYQENKFRNGIFLDVDNDILYLNDKTNLILLDYPSLNYKKHFEIPHKHNRPSSLYLKIYDDNYLTFTKNGQLVFLDRSKLELDNRIDLSYPGKSGVAWSTENWLITKIGSISYWIPKK